VHRWSAAEHNVYVGVVDASFGARTLGIVAAQRALVDFVPVEVPQERLDPCGNPPPLVGNPPAAVTDPDVPVVLVPLLVRSRIHFSNPLGVGVEDADDDVFRRLEGLGVPTDNVQQKLAARATVFYYGVQLRIAGNAVPPEIAPPVAFQGILATQIGPGWLLSIVPQSWQLDVLSHEGLPESPRFQGVSIRRILGQLVSQEGGGRNRFMKGNRCSCDSWYSLGFLSTVGTVWDRLVWELLVLWWLLRLLLLLFLCQHLPYSSLRSVFFDYVRCCVEWRLDGSVCRVCIRIRIRNRVCQRPTRHRTAIASAIAAQAPGWTAILTFDQVEIGHEDGWCGKVGARR
jgi:hypothetical protein